MKKLSNFKSQDYHSFGMGMPGRAWQVGNENYRFGFNRQEQVDEVYGNGNLNTALFWEYDTRLGRRWNVDPIIKHYESSYVAFSDNPILYIDTQGNDKDWYQNNVTEDYTWYDGSDVKEGFTHIGGKGTVLGEFENHINDNLINVYDVDGGMYSEGFTFDIVDNNKGALLPIDGKGGGNFLDEFVNGTGPEFSVLLSDHPYTETMKNSSTVKTAHKMINSGSTEVPGQITNVKSSFGVRGYLSSFSIAEQYIGKYRFDAFTSQDGNYLNNIISDTKSRSSLLYNSNVTDVRRNHPSTQTWGTGTTYQFYIWQTPKK